MLTAPAVGIVDFYSASAETKQVPAIVRKILKSVW